MAELGEELLSLYILTKFTCKLAQLCAETSIKILCCCVIQRVALSSSDEVMELYRSRELRAPEGTAQELRGSHLCGVAGRPLQSPLNKELFQIQTYRICHLHP